MARSGRRTCSRSGWLCTGVILLIFAGSIWYLANSQVLHHQTRARLRRFLASCFFQCTCILMSICIWKTLSSLFDDSNSTFGFHKREVTIGLTCSNSKRRTLSKIWRILVAAQIFSAHMAYTTFVLFMATEPFKLGILFFFSFGFQIQLFTGLVMFNCLHVIARVVHMCMFSKSTNKKYQDRSKLKGALTVIYAVTISLSGVMVASMAPVVKEIRVPIRGLPDRLNPLTVTFISDIHLGPTVGRSRLEKVLNTVNYLNADVTIIGGDLVDGTVDHLEEAVQPLAWINSKYGVYFVTGNHEYYTADVENWLKLLTSLGVTPLHNSHVTIPRDGTRDVSDVGLCVVGVDDPTADAYQYTGHGTQGLDKTLSRCPQDEPVIFVAHQPNTVSKALKSDRRVDLALAGHTHGGQLFPLNIGVFLNNDFFSGLYQISQYQHVYVSMGTIFWGMPMRVGSRAEITHLTLVQSS